MDLTYEQSSNKIYGKMKVDFFNDYEEPVSVLKFNLYPNAYRQNAKYSPVATQYISRAYYDGVSYGGIVIKSVVSGGKTVEFSVCGEDMNILSVPLEKEIFKGERAVVEIEFETTLAKVNHRLGVTENCINLTEFYPVLCGYDGSFYESVYYSVGDPYFLEVADYKFNITLPNDYGVACSGDIISTKKGEENSTYGYFVKNARSIALVLSKEYDCLTEKVGDITLNYYFYGKRNHEQTLKTAIKALNYFEKTFGKYPYDTFTVAETDFIQGGMEYSGLAFISSNLTQDAFDEVVVHETAHQWWYGGVGSNQTEYAFLDESLAEYSVVLFYENHGEYGLDRELLINSSLTTYRTYCSVYEKLFNKIDTRMIRPLSEFSGEYEYVNIAYIKGCVMLDNLRILIGENKFFDGLKRYYTGYLYEIATPYDLAGAFEKTGVDTGGFFQSYFDGKVVL